MPCVATLIHNSGMAVVVDRILAWTMLEKISDREKEALISGIKPNNKAEAPLSLLTKVKNEYITFHEEND